jgi:uncharacterized membrane protein YphA (DoxX/SURF4 family)
VSLWSTREDRTKLLFAGLRVMMGGIFLAVWSFNLRNGYYSPHGWAHFVGHYADTTTVATYASFLKSVMIPHANIAARGQFVLELAVALGLLAGLLTPVVGLLGSIFQLNLLVATSGTTDWPGTYIIMCLLLAAIALAQAGRTWGLDASLAQRRSRPRLPVY